MAKLSSASLSNLLWILLGILSLGAILALVWLPDQRWVAVALLVGVILSIGTLVFRNLKSFSGRTASYGLEAFVYILITLGFLTLINFLAVRHPMRWDLTQSKRHSLADQSVKVLKDLKQPVKATFFYLAPGQKEQAKALLKNYQTASSKFELEWVDAKKERLRVQAAGVTHDGTLLLQLGEKTSKVESPTEEKLTNALIKLAKEKTTTFCATTGHGEKNLNGTDDGGYQFIKKGLEGQGNLLKEINLLETKSVPANCDAIGIIGPKKAFLPDELEAVSKFLDEGGRALFAIDPEVEGTNNLKTLVALLEAWNIKSPNELILDEISAKLPMVGDVTSIVVQNLSKDHVITKDMPPASRILFAVSRPLEAIPNPPAGLNVTWLAKSLRSAFTINDFAALKKRGGQVNPEGHSKSERTLAITAEGKKPGSKASRNSRIVVFGSATFAVNAYAPFTQNADLFLNGASWALEDESLISIRAKEEGAPKFSMSNQQYYTIWIGSGLVVPLAVAIFGIVVWLRRKRL